MIMDTNLQRKGKDEEQEYMDGTRDLASEPSVWKEMEAYSLVGNAVCFPPRDH